MSKYRDKFPNGHNPNAKRLRARSERLMSPALRYAEAFCENILGLDPQLKGEHTDSIESRIVVADPKSLTSIERKAHTNYSGDYGRVKDGARLTILTNTREEMENVLTAFSSKGLNNNRFHRDMQRRSSYSFHDKPKNYVSNPKRWGYVALYAVLEHGNQGDTFEVQVYPACMQEIYKKTHGMYERARASGNLERWENAFKDPDMDEEPKLSDYLTPSEIKILIGILRLHKEGLEKAGIMNLIKDFPKIDDAPPLIPEPDIKSYPQDVPDPDHEYEGLRVSWTQNYE